MSSPRRVAIITGAAGGLGKAIALKLASDGFNVALNDLPGSLHELEDVAARASQYGVDAILVPGDVSSEADVEKMVDLTVNRFGGLDAMIANAGIADRGASIAEMTTEQWDRMLAVHVRGTFLCYKHSVRQMIKQGRGGRLLGASSVLGLHALHNIEHAHYCAAKFAIRGLTQSVALEVGKYGITANVYAPGLINTPMIDGLSESNRDALKEAEKNAVGHPGQPDDVANVVSFLVSEKSGFITGQTISVNGGWHLH